MIFDWALRLHRELSIVATLLHKGFEGFESSGVATAHERLVPCDVQDPELAFVQHGVEVARFAFDLV